MTRIRSSIDVLLGLTGYVGTLTAITILTSWPWALLAGSLTLIVLALVVPNGTPDPPPSN